MTDKSLLFYLDDILLETDPRGWSDINFFIKRDKDLNGLLVFIDAELEFFDDGYDYLTGKLYDDGFCQTVNLRIMESCLDGNYRTIHEGVIFLSKLTIDEKNCGAKVKPDDNSFYAKIDKNRSLNVLPWVEQSKNGVEIDAAIRDKIGFFNPVDGVYHSIITTPPNDWTCSGYRAYEIFKYLIAWMTDDTVDFDSTLFGPGGDLEFFCLTTGTVLFTVTTGLPEAGFKDTFPEDLSFDNFFKEVFKKENIGFYIDYSGLKPKLWIERTQDIPTGVDAVTLDNIYNIKTTVDNQRLYSTIHIGSSQVQNVPSLSFPNVVWLGFNEEEYNVLGNCGVDTTLDLVSDYIIDTNVIEDAIETPSNNYEGQFAFIECREYHTGVHLAQQTNQLNPPAPPYYYNQGLINSEVAKRFTGSVPNTIAKIVGNLDATFLATRTSDGSYTEIPRGAVGVWFEYEPIPFENDFNTPNHDADNVWTAAVPPSPNGSTFIAPANGQYSFTASIKWHFYHNNFPESAPTENEVWLRRYDTLDALVTSYRVASWSSGAVVSDYEKILTGSTSIKMGMGEKIKVMFRTRIMTNPILDHNTAFRVLHDSTFSCDVASIGRVGFQTYDPKDYLGLQHEFEYPINESQWQAIRTNPRGNIVFAQANQDFRRAIIDTIRFNKTGISQVKLIRSMNL